MFHGKLLVITRGYISKHLKTSGPVRRSWDFLSASTSASVGGDPRNCTWGFLAKPWRAMISHDINGTDISMGFRCLQFSWFHCNREISGFSRRFNRNRDVLPRNSPWSILKTDPLNSDIPKKPIGRYRTLRKLRIFWHVVARGPTRPSHAIPTTGDSRPISVSPVAGVS